MLFKIEVIENNSIQINKVSVQIDTLLIKIM